MVIPRAKINPLDGGLMVLRGASLLVDAESRFSSLESNVFRDGLSSLGKAHHVPVS
jgi:hypothetical protein